MESHAHAAVGVFIIAAGVVMAVFLSEGFTDVFRLLTAVTYAVAGLLFVFAGTGRTLDVAGTRVTQRHFVGVANVLVAVTFVPSVWGAFGGGTGDVAYGVASGIAAVVLLVLGVLFLTGRMAQAS